MAERPLYPFTAIVGQERMKLALLLNAVHPALGGVLIRGEQGTAKSTAVRGLAALLPEIEAVQGCAYGCDPAEPEPCEECAAHRAAGEAVEIVRRRVPMVELPVGATEDRVLGSLDLERAIGAGERRFEPGLLAHAHRGILYVDEVNLLNDHLVDILLDAAAMGRNYVEREGISVSHPARFMLIGTMNPEEGDLRPQLLDRFALTVEVEAPRDPVQRAEVVRRRMAFEADPARFIAAHAAGEASERERLARARQLLPGVTVPPAMVDLIVHVCAAFDVRGLRADLAMYRAAAARAAYEGRTEVTSDDVRAAAELALPHRRRRQPFEQPGLDQQRLEEALANAEEERGEPDEGWYGPHPPAPSPTRGEEESGTTDSGAASTRLSSSSKQGEDRSTARTQATAPPSPLVGEGGRGGEGRTTPTAPPSPPYPTVPLVPRTGHTRGPRAAGRQGAGGSLTPRGPAVRATIPHGPPGELALGATIRAAAPYQQARRQTGGLSTDDDRQAPGGMRAALLDQPPRLPTPHSLLPYPRPALLLKPPDLREKLREGKPRHLVILVVDASGSAGARDRMAAAKGAILSLLLDAYRRRDRVGMIAFRGAGAELLLPPTNSVDLAERRLRALPTGGRTPLAAGIDLCHATIERARRDLDAEPLVVLISDVRPNAGPLDADPWSASLTAAEGIRTAGWSAVVIDTEPSRSALGLGRALAEAMGARHLRLEHLRAGQLEGAIRWARGQGPNHGDTEARRGGRG